MSEIRRNPVSPAPMPPSPPKPRQPQTIPEDLLAEREAIEAACRPEEFSVLTRLLSNPDFYPVISFGGGGSPGMAGNAALAGILEELGARDRIREIWGTSAGAIVGAAWASGTPVVTIHELLQDLNRKGFIDFSRWEIFVKAPLRFALRGRVPEGLIRGRYFRWAIERGLAVKTFEELPIPLRLVSSTDDGRALRVIHRTGPLVPAIEASICLPGIMMPVKSWTGEDFGYFDGAVAEKTPLLMVIEDHDRQDRAQELLILCTHFPAGGEFIPPRGFIQRFVSVMFHLENQLWEYQAAKAQANPRCHAIMLKPVRFAGHALDFKYITANYLYCRRSFKQWLSDGAIMARFNSR